MKQLYLTLLFALLTITAIQAQPQRELRSVWLTSVFNIDWPHSTSTSTANQQARLITILDDLQAANFNAVMFQVRPNADALYESSYEPWSAWITGVRGQQPSYDPLAFLLQEANKRGIEVHAWINPYRFENTAGQYAGRPGDYTQTHPELIINYNGKTYFNPGLPETTQLIKSVIADLITRYDIDGVLFDDYFYPSNLPSTYDQQAYDMYATEDFVGQWYSTITRGNFRRASVNNMIREVNDTIKAVRPGMVFGVSPAGIYSTQSSAATQWGTTLPAGISGNDNYNAINCDPLAWLRDQSVDYISPQLYWQIGGAQDFITLTNWWANEAKRRDRHHYPSLGSYRLFSSKSTGEPLPGDYYFYSDYQKDKGITGEEPGEKFNWPLSEIGNQIIANRNSANNLAQGIIFYNTKSTVDPSKDLAAYLAEDLFAEKAIFPLLEWLPEVQPGAPAIAEIGVAGGMDNATAAITITGSEANRFLLYGHDGIPTKDSENNGEFLQVVFGRDFSEFYHNDKFGFSIQEYFTNRELGLESTVVSYQYLAPATLQDPNNEAICDGFLFQWSDVAEADNYQVQIARASDPGTVVYQSELLTTAGYTLPESILEGQQNWVYRIKSISGASVSWSPQGTFETGQPLSTQINSPSNGATTSSLNVNFQWNSVQQIDHYHIQIATDASFSPELIVVDQQPVNFNLYTATLTLNNTPHYARVRTVNDCGGSIWSPVVSFTTPLGNNITEPERTTATVYPNPATNNAHILYPGVVDKRTILVYDTAGRLVILLKKDVGGNEDVIEMGGLEKGFYTIRVEMGNGKRYILKVLKTL